VVALVGYTNAGKSTLFNRMTGADVMAKDLLFATLDPTMRQIRLPGLDKAILSDTVGFVSDLPTQLVAAFRATLEEVTTADIIVHVRDMSHPDSEAQAEDVARVLAEIGATGEPDEEGEDSVPMIEAWNKVDALDPEAAAVLHAEAARRDDAVVLSALTGEGVDDLRRFVSDRLSRGARVRTVRLAASDGAAIAWLHQHGEVLATDTTGEIMSLDVRISDVDWARFEARE
jgi:GTP-binding protein HflX